MCFECESQAPAVSVCSPCSWVWRSHNWSGVWTDSVSGISRSIWQQPSLHLDYRGWYGQDYQVIRQQRKEALSVCRMPPSVYVIWSYKKASFTDDRSVMFSFSRKCKLIKKKKKILVFAFVRFLFYLLCISNFISDWRVPPFDTTTITLIGKDFLATWKSNLAFLFFGVFHSNTLLTCKWHHKPQVKWQKNLSLQICNNLWTIKLN